MLGCAALWGNPCCWELPLGSSSPYSWPWSEVPHACHHCRNPAMQLNLYPGGEKLAVTAEGQERNNLPSDPPGTWEGL